MTRSLFRHRVFRPLLVCIGLTGLLTMLPAGLQLGAQTDTQGPPVAPAAFVSVDAAQAVTWDQIKAFEQQHAAPQAQEIPFLPTISKEEYQQFKAAAAAAVGEKPAEASGIGVQAPTLFSDFDGVGQAEACGGCRPPDTNGTAATDGTFLELTNTRVNVFDAGFGTPLMSTDLAAFFGTTDFVFDPRVLHDDVWDRLIIVATRHSASAADPNRRWFLAVSQTNSPLGGWFITTFNFGGGAFANGDWWDYPHLGQEQDAILVTGNIFNNADFFRFGAVCGIAKARLYNGLGFFVPIFLPGGFATIAAPNVLDQNGNDFFVAAPTSGNVIRKFTMTNASHPAQTAFFGPANIPVASYTVPPNAPQPGTTATLNTLDSRFLNNAPQMGDRLFEVHTVNLVGFAAPKYYEFNTSTNSTVQQAFFFLSGSSHDFNASISANENRDAFVTWSATDPPVGVNAQVRISGRCHNDPLNTMNPPGTLVVQSPSNYVLFRWGDYSSIPLDPFDHNFAWFTNEQIANSTTWGTHWGQVGNFPACP